MQKGTNCIASFHLRYSEIIRIQRERDDFIPCVAFNSIAENIYNFLSKGKKVRITGSLQSSDYVNSDGEKVYSLTLVVNEFEMLFPKEKTIEDYEKIFNEVGED